MEIRLLQVMPADGRVSAVLEGGRTKADLGRTEPVVAWALAEVHTPGGWAAPRLLPVLSSGELAVPGETDSTGWAIFTGRYCATPAEDVPAADPADFLAARRCTSAGLPEPGFNPSEALDGVTHANP